MSLCFREAFLAKNRHNITEEDYFRHLLAHFQGVRHPQDSSDEDIIVSKLDPVGASIRVLALKTDYPILEDTAQYEKLFYSCLRGNLDEVRSGLKQVVKQKALPVPIQPLAALASRKTQVEILQFCLDEGAILDANLDRAMELGASNPAMLNLLLAVNWRDIQHSHEDLDWLLSHHTEIDILTWLLDHGARINSKTIQQAALGPTPVSTITFLIERSGVGIAILKNSGALQNVARGGEQDMVKFLLDASIDVDEIPRDLDIRESRPYTALFEAVQGQQVEVVRLLLDAGAKVTTPCGLHGETPLQEANRLGNSEILDLLNQSI